VIETVDHLDGYSVHIWYAHFLRSQSFSILTCSLHWEPGKSNILWQC